MGKLNSHKIGICFNNAGIAENNINRWLRNEPQHIIDLMNIHATVPTLITHAVLAQMLERRNGLMLIMSSGSGICPLEQLPVYGSPSVTCFTCTTVSRSSSPRRNP